jgi:hypothetical protein
MTEMLTLPREANASQGVKGEAPSVPLFVPQGQLYYWSNEWQDGENEALNDLAAGRFRTFATGSAAAAWLLRDED